MKKYTNASFFCIKCSYEITQSVEIPQTSDDHTSASFTFQLNCPECQHLHSLLVRNENDMVSGKLLDCEKNIDINFSEAFEILDFDWLFDGTKHIETLEKSLNSVQAFIDLEIDIDDQAEFSLNVMMFTHLIASFEGYIASVFISEVLQSEELVYRLIREDPELNKQRFLLSEIYRSKDFVKNRVAHYLKDLIYHRMDKTKTLYKVYLHYDFSNIGWLFKAINKRHDCVHRGGYTKDGQCVDISTSSIKTLLEKIRDLSNDIENQIARNRFYTIEQALNEITPSQEH